MKKRIVAIACAAALMLALPTLAWAAPSPFNEQTESNGVTANVTGNGVIEVINATSTTASNVPTGTDIIASFEIVGNATDVTLTFNVGAKYAGYSYTVYIQHENSTEVKTGTVDDRGNIVIKVNELSIFSIAIGEAGAASSAVSNTGATSPQTGVDLGTVAGATIVMTIAAGAVFVALRKKVNE